MNKFLKEVYDNHIKATGGTLSYEDFCSQLEECMGNNKKMMEAQNSFQSLIDSYQKKRRGEDVQDSFDSLENSFKESLAFLIQEKSPLLLESYDKPFIKELFEKYTIKESEEIKLKPIEKIFSDFIFFKQWWKPKFVEEKSLDRFIMSTAKGFNVSFDSNIFEFKNSSDSTPFYLVPSANYMGRVSEGIEYIKPMTEGINETLMPCWLKMLLSGKVCIQESKNEIEFEFQSQDFSGIYKATRDSNNSDFWKVSKKS